MFPCYNEEATIAQVVADFRRALPEAEIYVYDNNSTDRTAEVARASGAIVRCEPLQGKGNVVRRMFADIEAEVYVLVDGDSTYDAESAPRMIRHLMDNQLDMVNGARVTDIQEAYRPGHRFGNWLLTSIVAWTFGNRLKDMLSGYRVFSRRYVKSFPSLAVGFEIETELTVHALHLRMPIAEIETPYKDRPAGSTSKLSTYRDGLRILWMILVFIKEEKPMAFFSLIGLNFCLCRHHSHLPHRAGIYRHRSGAAPAHGGAFHGHDDHRLSQFRLRPDPGHGHPRPQRDETDALSEHPGHAAVALIPRALPALRRGASTGQIPDDSAPRRLSLPGPTPVRQHHPHGQHGNPHHPALIAVMRVGQRAADESVAHERRQQEERQQGAVEAPRPQPQHNQQRQTSRWQARRPARAPGSGS